jgi:glycosyltransferase involved in cell wall biosynthesis
LVAYADLTVVIPHIPVRTQYLSRALRSILRQTLQPRDIIVVTDTDHEGAAVTRNRGLAMVQTPYVAFLDDDDELRPHHIETCGRVLEDEDAAIVYPWFDVIGGTDPLGMFGVPFDPEHLKVSNYIPVTVVAQTQALQDVGGFILHPDALGHPNEDWGCWLAVHNAGGKIVHVPSKTWIWRHDSQNTSGRGDRW